MQPNEQTVPTPQPPVEIKKHPGGRPVSITTDKVAKLVMSFQRGHSVGVTLRYARVSPDSFYRMYNSNEEFRNKIDDAKDFAVHLAGDIIVDTLHNKKVGRVLKTKTAQWYLERKEPEEFGRKPLIELNDNRTTNQQYNFIPNEEFKALTERAGVSKLNPATLVAALANGNVGRSEQSEASVAVDIQELGSENSEEESLP